MKIELLGQRAQNKLGFDGGEAKAKAQMTAPGKGEISVKGAFLRVRGGESLGVVWHYLLAPVIGTGLAAVVFEQFLRPADAREHIQNAPAGL